MPHLKPVGISGVDPWHEFAGQSANPGVVPADTLYQDDGTNYDAGTLVWGDISNPTLIGSNFSVGDPGLEQGGINVNGTTYDAVQKINSIGGALDSSLILHRHSTTFPPIITFARSNNETTAHTPVAPGQTLGSQIYVGWSGTHYDIGAVLDVRVPAGTTVSATSLPSEFVFFTAPDGSDAAIEALRVNSDQSLTIANSYTFPAADGGANEILQTDGAGNLTFTAFDHGDLSGLGDDDHSQYFLLAGRSGGQSAFGSPVNGQNLTIAGNPGANPGFINMNSPVIFGPYSGNASAAYGFSYTATESFTSGFIGGGLNFSGNITFSAPTFIYESFRGAPTINTAANPGFAAYTVLQALPLFNAGAGAGHNPLAPLILNAAPTLSNGFAGTRTTGTSQGINFSPQTRATLSGATMSVTNQIGLKVSPTYSTVAGSTANLGTVRGLHLLNPAGAFGQPTAGAETMTAYIGVDVNAIPFAGNVTKAAVRSALAPASNTNFLLNDGNAKSDHGAGNLYFDDNAGVAFGGVGSSVFDAWIRWASASSALAFQFFNTGDWMELSSPSADRFLFDTNSGTGEFNFNCHNFTLGAQTGPVGNGVGLFVTPARATGVNGGWADFNLTQAGNLTIDHTMSDVTAWNLNPISLTGGTGSITGYVAGLSVGMTTSGLGGAETHALYLRGRQTIRGVHAHEPLNPAQLTANVNNYSPATGNSMRQMWRIDQDAARSITGIVAQQANDTQRLTNISAFNLTLTHQDAASTAANRIISPTGASYVLAPNQSAELWYDTAVSRWILLWVSPVVQSAAYTPTNVTTDRAYNANLTSVNELADVLGTVISDLQAAGILG